MTHYLIRLLLLAVAVLLISRVLPGMKINGFRSALLVCFVYGVLNVVLFKVLFLFTWPVVLLKWLTFGVFSVIVNALVLMLTDKLLDGFELSGFGTALLAALGLMIANVGIERLLVIV